ncbi:MAG TPA: hypothetical protein VHF46_01915 [Rubrobacteraceae bacterium]|nr:hypothetical protein [Rubrobacteraceae bacterium]
MAGENERAGKEQELTTENGIKRLQEGSSDKAYWLIARQENGRTKVLTTDIAGEKKVLPVFSYGEEAEMFLGLGALEDGWQVKKSAAVDLLSMLFGPCSNVGRVALDPLPETVTGTMANPSMCLDRERFMNRFIGDESIRLNSSVREPSLL